jgi:hypothetical protein
MLEIALNPLNHILFKLFFFVIWKNSTTNSKIFSLSLAIWQTF